jgi:hypothetical protein
MNPKNPDEIEIMRHGGKMLAGILDSLTNLVVPGAKPKDIAKSAAEQIKKSGMQPVVLGYEGFPDVICISVNNEIVHGIPKSNPIKDGDVVKLDLTLGYKSMVVDSARTIIAGTSTNADVKRLVEGTKKSLDAGINAIKGSGTRVGDIAVYLTIPSTFGAVMAIGVATSSKRRTAVRKAAKKVTMPITNSGLRPGPIRVRVYELSNGKFRAVATASSRPNSNQKSNKKGRK